MITFHTDLRSPKIGELRHDPRIALVGIDSARTLQIRMLGEARVIRDEQVCYQAWKRSLDSGVIAYRTRLAPGTVIRRPDDAFGEQCNVGGPDEGFTHFCVVEVRPTGFDWLDWSATDSPRRARYVREGDDWIANWIAP